MEDNTNQNPVQSPQAIPEEPVQPIQPSTPPVELPTQPITPPPLEKPVMREVPKPKSKVLPILITFLMVGLLSILGYWGYNKYFVSQEQTTVEVSPTPVATIGPTLDWQIYSIDTLNVSFKLPPEITEESGKLSEKVYSGQKGTMLTFFDTDSQVLQPFSVGTTSVDYLDGRGGLFSDLQGFIKEGDKYMAKFVQGRTFDIPTNLVTEINNDDFGIIRIIGQSYTTGEYRGPIAGTPGDGYVGAIINIPLNKTYTGLTINMKLDDEHTIKLFDQILSTFKFTDQTEDITWKNDFISIPVDTEATGKRTYKLGFSYPSNWTYQHITTTSAKFKTAWDECEDKVLTFTSPSSNVLKMAPICKSWSALYEDLPVGYEIIDTKLNQGNAGNTTYIIRYSPNSGIRYDYFTVNVEEKIQSDSEMYRAVLASYPQDDWYFVPVVPAFDNIKLNTNDIDIADKIVKSLNLSR